MSLVLQQEPVELRLRHQVIRQGRELVHPLFWHDLARVLLSKVCGSRSVLDLLLHVLLVYFRDDILEFVYEHCDRIQLLLCHDDGI